MKLKKTTTTALLLLAVVGFLTTTLACTVNVSLSCKSSSGAPCGQLQPRTTNCFETISWEIGITNGGAIPLTITRLDLVRGPTSSLPLLSNLPVNPIAPGASTGMGPRTDVNLCVPGGYSASAIVAGTASLPNSAGTTTCSADAAASFVVMRYVGPGGPTPPAPAPRPSPTPPAPRPSPVATMPVPTTSGRACRVICARGFSCSADGGSCFRTSPNTPVGMPVPMSVPSAPVLSPRSMQVPVPVPVPNSPVQAPRPSGNNAACRVTCASGFTCSADGMSCFRSNTVPSGPTSNIMPTPRASPTAASLPVVDCTLNASIACRLDRNGANCNTLVPRTNNCQEAVTYEVSMRNAGGVALTVTQATLTIDGRGIDLLSSVRPNPVTVGGTATGRTSATINVCNVAAVDFLARLAVRGAPPAGYTCRPAVPAPAPQMMPVAQRPVAVPQTSPVARTVVDCTIVPGLTCLLSDGRPCSSVVPRTSNCDETFRYRLAVQNAGSIALPITTARILVNNNGIDVLSRLSSNPVPVGSTATATTDVVVNVCGAYASQASIEVRVGQVPDQYMCSNYIPKPISIDIGGPPVPRPTMTPPAPAPVPTPRTQLVDCIIRSTLVSCEQANGSSCANIVPPPSCAPVELFFNVRLQNAGTVELTVTTANLVTAAGSNSFLRTLPANPLAIGQTSNVRVPASMNVCAGNNLSASVNVAGAPPPGFTCR